jgi:hypothetical protein
MAACTSSAPTDVESDAAKPSKLEVSPTRIDFGSEGSTSSFTLTNAGTRAIEWSASEDAGWLSLGASSGTMFPGATRTVGVSAQRGSMAPGTYTAMVQVAGARGAGSETVSVSMTVPAASQPANLEVTPLQVDFGTSGTSVSVTLKNTGDSPLTWTASESAGWLSLAATSGSLAARSSKTLALSANRTGMTAGTYTTGVAVSAGTAGSATETVSMTVPTPPDTTTPSPAQLSVSPLQVDFGTSGTTASVTLSNTGESSLSWTASESTGWLSLGATAGSLAGKSSKTLSLAAQRSGMTPGTYTAGVLVSAGTAGSATASVSMTVPTSTDPSPSVLLAGTLVDQFSGQAMAGLDVEFAGVTARTDASGAFTIQGAPTTTLRTLTLSGAGVYRRVTYAKTGDNRWGVVPGSFNMTAYNDVARNDWGSFTVRWTSAPTVYVDARPEGFEGGEELERWIAEVQSQAAAFVSKWTGSTISPQSVIVTSNPPRDFTGGTIVIHFSENSSDYGNSSTAIGYARVSRSSSGVIAGSAVWLRYLRYSGTSGASKRTGILGHELGHAMGMGHMTSGTPSFMEPSIGSKTDLSSFDRQAAALLYGRTPGNTAPDTDSSSTFAGSLSPSAAATSVEWICGEEAGRP